MFFEALSFKNQGQNLTDTPPDSCSHWRRCHESGEIKDQLLFFFFDRPIFSDCVSPQSHIFGMEIQLNLNVT